MGAIEQLTTTTGEVVSGQLRVVTKRLRVKKGILYFQHRIVVPSSARDVVLQKVHVAEHFGQARTLQNLRLSYF